MAFTSQKVKISEEVKQKILEQIKQQFEDLITSTCGVMEGFPEAEPATIDCTIGMKDDDWNPHSYYFRFEVLIKGNDEEFVIIPKKDKYLSLIAMRID